MTERYKLAMDAALDLQRALQDALPYIGEVDLNEIDGPADIYEMIFKSCGLDFSNIDESLYPDMMRVLTPAAGGRGGTIKAMDAAMAPPDSEFYKRWPELKPAAKRLVK